MAEVYPHPKMNPIQWVENFFYHYRWQFIFSLIVAAFIGIAAFQFFTRKDPDVSFYYVGPVALSDEICKGIVSSAQEELSRDYNGNGKIEADIRTQQLSTELDLLSPHQKNEANEGFQSYTEEILTGDSCFLLVSPEFYEALMDFNDDGSPLMSYYEIFGEDAPEGELLNGVPLRKTPLWQKPGFDDLPSDTVLCLKYAGGVNGAQTNDEVNAANEQNVQIFRDLCS